MFVCLCVCFVCNFFVLGKNSNFARWIRSSSVTQVGDVSYLDLTPALHTWGEWWLVDLVQLCSCVWHVVFLWALSYPCGPITWLFSSHKSFFYFIIISCSQRRELWEVGCVGPFGGGGVGGWLPPPMSPTFMSHLLLA